MKKVKYIAQILLIGGLSITSACAEKKVTAEKSTDTFHNVFTGNDTVTETKNSTYQNQKTGALRSEKNTIKTKFDKNGKKLSESKETEKQK